jgi:hypothetical protein
MHLDRDASAIVTDGDGAVRVDRDLDARTISGQMLIDGVIEHLKDTVMETSLIGITDVHAWALTNRLETLEFVDLGRSVFLASRGVLLFRNVAVVEGDDGFCGFFFSHGRVSDLPLERSGL